MITSSTNTKTEKGFQKSDIIRFELFPIKLHYDVQIACLLASSKQKGKYQCLLTDEYVAE